ncbi:MAG: hypothetical protein H7A53_08110 [Akkermansiaceae bacterium]|nr:hypothetical protein [Akkermansiaceae bacterium]
MKRSVADRNWVRTHGRYRRRTGRCCPLPRDRSTSNFFTKTHIPLESGKVYSIQYLSKVQERWSLAVFRSPAVKKVTARGYVETGDQVIGISHLLIRPKRGEVFVSRRTTFPASSTIDARMGSNTTSVLAGTPGDQNSSSRNPPSSTAIAASWDSSASWLAKVIIAGIPDQGILTATTSPEGLLASATTVSTAPTVAISKCSAENIVGHAFVYICPSAIIGLDSLTPGQFRHASRVCVAVR